MYYKISMTNSDPTGIAWLKGQYAIEREGFFLFHTDIAPDAIKEELLRTADGVEITEISQQECWDIAGYPMDSPFMVEKAK
jgi:hypothetical protein